MNPAILAHPTRYPSQNASAGASPVPLSLVPPSPARGASTPSPVDHLGAPVQRRVTDAPKAPSTAAALVAPAPSRPRPIAPRPPDLDAETRRACHELIEAVDRNDWVAAQAAVQVLSGRLQRAEGPDLPLSLQDDIMNALGYALPRAEEEDRWSIIEIILGCLFLLPFLLDALIVTDAERVIDAAEEGLEREAELLAARLVSARGEATQDDAHAVTQDLKKLPPAVLRKLVDGGTRVYAVRSGVLEAIGRTLDDTTPDARELRVLGAYDNPDNEAAVLTELGRRGTPRVAYSPDKQASPALHEAMHAYDALTGASQDPKFLLAVAADRSALTPHENQPNPRDRARETYAETTARYLEGDRTLSEERPYLWRYCLGAFGPR